jgi:multidrug transporter EmrE-like cation transporter
MVPEEVRLSTEALPIQNVDPVVTRKKRQRSLMLVFGCTVLGAAAQTLMKIGASNLTYPTMLETFLAMATNVPLVAGYALYGMSTLLLILALRHGELSLLYPVIALTYVWVSIISVFYFREVMNPFKLLGIAVIVLGVGILGRNSTK